MSTNIIEVSIIIPCRNEEKFIGMCLDSIISQDYPREKLEILVIDGMSKDKTKKIVKKYSKKHPLIRLIENPQYFTPFGLNLGITNTIGDIIIRMDAHAIYTKDYISKCVNYLKKYNVDNVGGVIKILPRNKTLIGQSIALALSHPFGTGNSYFRIGSKEPRMVDTVFGGCYKKEIFDKIGLFNENLIRSQDIEFNLRLKKAGGKTLLAPDIVAYYYPKNSLWDFFIHTISDGIWAIYPLKFQKMPFKIRHYIPFIFITSLIILLLLSMFLPTLFWIVIFFIGLYLLTSLFFSIKIMLKEKKIRYLFIMPIVFATRHIAYGLGSIFGLIKLLK